jgi:hypothetical protein
VPGQFGAHLGQRQVLIETGDFDFAKRHDLNEGDRKLYARMVGDLAQERALLRRRSTLPFVRES